MKKVSIYEISDPCVWSWILDRAFFLLAHSPVQLRLSQLSRILDISPPVLTRIRLLHSNPQYGPFVNRQVLFNTLKFVLQHFPTLVLREAQDGKIQVHLYNKHGGHKLCPLPPELPVAPVQKRAEPKPGSTRWFLAQLEQEGQQTVQAG